MELKMTENAFSVQLEYGELTISGDERHGFRPYQLLVSSVAACSGGVLRKVLQKKKLHVEDIAITAEAERVESEANRISKIRLHFRVKGDLGEEQLRKSLEVTRRNCPIVQSVKDSIEVEETFELYR